MTIRHLPSRRRALAQSARLAALLAAAGLPAGALAQPRSPYNAAAFDAPTMAAAMKALGAAMPLPSRDVSIVTDEIAENSASVLVAIASTNPGVRRLLVLVEKNPAALSAMFDVSEAVEPAFSIRLKLAETSAVYAVAILADGRTLYAKKDVRVTLGGCGT